MPFEFKKLEIDGLLLVQPRVFGDERGFFMESYKCSEFVQNGIDVNFIQDNHSMSEKGVLRGLHYQLYPKAQAKLVRCIRGTIFDVAVDIRQNSSSFGKWFGLILSEENKKMLYIPEGFAHGFAVISDKAELIYKTTNEYSPDLDRGIRWNDPDIAIDWNINFEPTISQKDSKQPFLKEIKELL